MNTFKLVKLCLIASMVFVSFSFNIYGNENNENILIPEAKILWELQELEDKPLYTLINNTELIVITQDGNLEKRNKYSGELINSFNINEIPTVIPTIKEDLCIYPTTKGNVVCVNLKNGNIVWEETLKAKRFSQSIIYNNKIYFAYQKDGFNIIVLELETGKTLSKINVEKPIVTQASVLNNKILFPSLGGDIYQLDIETNILSTILKTNGSFSGQKILVQKNGLLISPSEYYRKGSLIKIENGIEKTLWSKSYKRKNYVNSEEYKEISFMHPERKKIELAKFRKTLAKRFTDKIETELPEGFYPTGPVHTSSWVSSSTMACMITKEPGMPGEALFTLIVVNVNTGEELFNIQRLSKDVRGTFCIDPIIIGNQIIAVLGKNVICGVDVLNGDVVWENKLENQIVGELQNNNNSILFKTTDGSIVNLKSMNNQIIPNNFSLAQNTPNPFNPSTTIKYALPLESRINLVIYNISGKRIISLINESKNAGNYSVVWNGRNSQGKILPSGIYFAKLKAESYTKTIRMILLK